MSRIVQPHRMVLPATPRGRRGVREVSGMNIPGGNAANEARVNAEMVGHRFGRLTVLSVDGSGHGRRVRCQCECGKITEAWIHHVRAGHTVSCGCERQKTAEGIASKTDAEMVGRRFGKFVVLSVEGTTGKRRAVCQCDCGKEKSILLHRVRTGRSRSCGCERDRLTGERNTTHGATRGHTHGAGLPSEWVIWINMIYRCTDPKNHAYASYGGRGISVCDRWLGEQGYLNFLADMGPRPSNRHSIDRKDNDGPYSPDNCRWATQREQCRNKRDNHVVEYQGRKMCLADLADEVGMNRGTMFNRLKRGLTPEEAVSRPLANVGLRAVRVVQ